MASTHSLAVPAHSPLAISRALLRALRPYQWGKNLFLFAALLFSGKIQEPAAVLRSLLGFGLFCAAASCVYLLNDLKDYRQDQLHPDKRRRPLASGALPIPVALVAMIVLMLLALGGSYLLAPSFCGLVAIYLCINLVYSMGMKRFPILDVMSIATGFVIRAVAGAVVIHEIASAWMVLCTMMLALVLGFGKRRGELQSLQADASKHRENLKDYPVALLDMLITISASAAMVTYSLYTLSPETVVQVDSKAMVLTVPFVIFGIFRYLYLTQTSSTGSDPSRLLFTDVPMLVNGVLWVLTCAGILFKVIYWPFW